MTHIVHGSSKSKTTIPTTTDIRDRLKSYGSKGETYSDILARLMDTADYDLFMGRMYARLDEKDQFVSLDELE
ncbi:hypothetical protein [Methanococcoides alaskense]|uniref:Uncharacterized protein n=1 Tax=Methanococcoides alaskense TaxID=325778 RepID=A0AA90TZ60_9EURY|nr:hypothetical protein [Methanococcoides alaskense]MDA0524546.1 hypothetical protein [Methanococcoides alaskense]MDR6222234.1 hypothetical protein [Methanococcoides alaskense]